MAKKFDHLDLIPYKKSFKRKLHGGGGYEKKENIKEFAEKQIAILDKISNGFKQVQKEIPDFSQDLFFKVKTSQKVNEDEFRKRLKGAGCETVFSSPGKNAEWVISSSDPDVKNLKIKINERTYKEKANFVDGILEFKEIKFEDKMGGLLKTEPLGKLEKSKLVISLTKNNSEVEDQKLNSSLSLIMGWADEFDLKFYDKLVTENLCLILMDCTASIAKKISQIGLVEKIDRPPHLKIEKIIGKNLKDFKQIKIPNEKDHGILVMDSGIILHPLMEQYVDHPDGIIGLPDRIIDDDKSHGTRVGSIALFEDIEKCINEQQFESNIWLYSAKIFYESNGDVMPIEDKLLGTGIQESLRDIKNKFPKCKVVNLSFGYNNRIMLPDERQFELATLIDDLAMKYKDTIFVISTGNIDPDYYSQNLYPEYLLSDDPDVKIVDPSTSIHAFSVGATSNFGDLIDQPSSLTRTGPGLNGMIKPDLVEFGGGFNENVTVLNPDFKQRLFTFSSGTSFSAPKIANQLVRLYNKFPTFGRNLIMALLLSSTIIPSVRPDSFPKIDSKTSTETYLRLMSVYGFGKPIFEDALYSDDERVVFKFEGKIRLNQAKYFTIDLPDEFVKEKGNREITVSLVFDPPVKRTRSDYFGSRMEFHLFKNKPVEEIMKKYNLLGLQNSENDDEIIPKELEKFEVKLYPGSELRKKSNHQKGVRILSTGAKIQNKHPLVLVVLSQKKWLSEDFNQDFAVVVTLKHQHSIDLYNRIRPLNQIRTQIRV